MNDEPGRFLAGIAAVIRRADDGRYLLMKRSSEKDVGGGVWECVTGRVNQGEGFEEALHREVREETRLAVTVEYILGTSHFYRGEARPEHELVGVVFGCVTDDADRFVPSHEHSETRWVTLEEARGLLTGDAPGTTWMLRILDRIAILGSETSPGIRAFFKREGVETG